MSTETATSSHAQRRPGRASKQPSSKRSRPARSRSQGSAKAVSSNSHQSPSRGSAKAAAKRSTWRTTHSKGAHSSDTASERAESEPLAQLSWTSTAARTVSGSKAQHRNRRHAWGCSLLSDDAAIAFSNKALAQSPLLAPAAAAETPPENHAAAGSVSNEQQQQLLGMQSAEPSSGGHAPTQSLPMREAAPQVPQSSGGISAGKQGSGGHQSGPSGPTFYKDLQDLLSLLDPKDAAHQPNLRAPQQLPPEAQSQLPSETQQHLLPGLRPQLPCTAEKLQEDIVEAVGVVVPLIRCHALTTQAMAAVLQGTDRLPATSQQVAHAQQAVHAQQALPPFHSLPDQRAVNVLPAQQAAVTQQSAQAQQAMPTQQAEGTQLALPPQPAPQAQQAAKPAQCAKHGQPPHPNLFAKKAKLSAASQPAASQQTNGHVSMRARLASARDMSQLPSRLSAQPSAPRLTPLLTASVAPKAAPSPSGPTLEHSGSVAQAKALSEATSAEAKPAAELVSQQIAAPAAKHMPAEEAKHLPLSVQQQQQQQPQQACALASTPQPGESSAGADRTKTFTARPVVAASVCPAQVQAIVADGPTAQAPTLAADPIVVGDASAVPTASDVVQTQARGVAGGAAQPGMQAVPAVAASRSASAEAPAPSPIATSSTAAVLVAGSDVAPDDTAASSSRLALPQTSSHAAVHAANGLGATTAAATDVCTSSRDPDAQSHAGSTAPSNNARGAPAWTPPECAVAFLQKLTEAVEAKRLDHNLPPSAPSPPAVQAWLVSCCL